jgi:TPR repeat protein
MTTPTVSAQYNGATLYANGQVVAQDYAEPVKWYRKAAGYGYRPYLDK